MPSTVPFRSGPPEVVLVQAFARPLDNAVATARTCYSAKGIITPAEVGGDSRPRTSADPPRTPRRARAGSLRRGPSHHVPARALPVRARPRVAPVRLVLPALPSLLQLGAGEPALRRGEAEHDDHSGSPRPAQEVYEKAVARRHRTTSSAGDAHAGRGGGVLQALPRPRASAGALGGRDPEEGAGGGALRAADRDLLLPLSHGLRAHAPALPPARDELDAPAEQRQVVQAMVDAVLAHDPQFGVLLEDPIPLEETLEYQFFQHNPGLASESLSEPARKEFDASLDGLVSRLIWWKTENEALLASSVREVLGMPRGAPRRRGDRAGDGSGEEHVSLRLTERDHHLEADPDDDASVLHLPEEALPRRRLAGSAPSRHPGSRPCLHAYLGSDPDYVVPALVLVDERVERRYRESMERTWESIGELRRLGARTRWRPICSRTR